MTIQAGQRARHGPCTTAYQLEVAVHDVNVQYKLQGSCCIQIVLRTLKLYSRFIFEFRTSEIPIQHITIARADAPVLVSHLYGNAAIAYDDFEHELSLFRQN